MGRRLLVFGALTCLAVVLVAAPAAAKGGGGGSHDRRISLSGALVVAADEVVTGPVVSVDGPTTITGRVNNDVFVGHGDLIVSGQVTGDVLVVDGNATITGRVSGDITDLHGRITVKPGASVHGDVTSSNAPNAAAGTVRGHVKTLDVTSIFTGFVVAFLLALWLAVTISLGILGFLFVVLFPRGADAVVVAGRRFGVSILAGLLVGILGPILGVAIVSTIVGIPLGIGLLAAMTVLAPLGYTSTALIIGRLMVRGPRTGSRIGAFFAGFAILRLVALIPGLGFIVWYAACFYGLGALTIAAWRAGHRRTVRAPSTPPAAAAVTSAPTRAPQPGPERPAPVTAPARPRVPSSSTRSRPAKKTAAKRAPAKKTTAKRAPAKKSTAKRAPAKKPAAKKSAARKPTGATRKAPAKSAAKKRGAPVRKSSSRAAGAAKRR